MKRSLTSPMNESDRNIEPVAAKAVGEVGDVPRPRVYLYVFELPFILILLPQFALYMYLHQRPPTMKNKLRKFSIKACGE
jgi:hypothetical protein